MSSLRDWLDEQTLQEELVSVRGRKLLVVEIDLAERSRLFATLAEKTGGKLTNQVIEGAMLARCVCDPETREQIVPTEDFDYWQKKGSSFSDVLNAALRVNGLRRDDVEDELKNSDTTTG